MLKAAVLPPAFEGALYLDEGRDDEYIPQEEEEYMGGADDEYDVELSSDEGEEGGKGKGKGKRKGQSTCSVCKSTGHNKRSCTTKSV